MAPLWPDVSCSLLLLWPYDITEQTCVDLSTAPGDFFCCFFCSHPAAAAVCRFLAACVRGKSIYGYRLMRRAAAELPPRPPPPTNPGLGAMRWSCWSVLVLLCKAAACIPQDHFLTQVGEQSAQEILEFQFKERSGRDSVGTHRADVWANYVMWLLQYIDSV